MRADIPKAGTPAAKARRHPTFNPSALTGGQQEVLGRLVATGELGFGEAWKSPLAREISTLVGRKIAPTQLMSWLRGDRPVPDYIAEILPQLAGRLVENLERKAATLRGLRDLK